MLQAMFLRRNRRTVNGEIYEYWTLVRTVRTACGPRQEVVARLGKLPGLDAGVRHGWEEVADLLDGRSGSPEKGRFDKPLPQSASTPQWTQVDVRGLRVERVRDFGQVYLALSLCGTSWRWRMRRP
jgi:hypothetical protein